MSKLSMKEQLRIANLGGSFEETGSNSWNGIRIRKRSRYGVVVKDMNGACRVLSVKFDDGKFEEIRMNNIGLDPEYVHDYEWYEKIRDRWYRF